MKRVGSSEPNGSGLVVWVRAWSTLSRHCDGIQWDCALESTNYLTRDVNGYQLNSAAAISLLRTSATGLGRWRVIGGNRRRTSPDRVFRCPELQRDCPGRCQGSASHGSRIGRAW